MRATITNAVGVIGAIGLAIGTSVFAGAGQAAAATEVPVTCHSDNPYPWLPAFDYRLSARTASVADRTGKEGPGLTIGGTSDNPNISPAPFLPYGVYTTVNWMNTTTHVNGTVSTWTSAALPTVDIAAKTGSGHVVFQVLPETSAVARYINTKTALCQAEIDVP